MLFATNVYAKALHFASIKDLAEQEVGAIVLPEIYRRIGIEISITPYPAKRAQGLTANGKTDGEIMRIYSYGLETPSVVRIPTSYSTLDTTAYVQKNSGISIKNRDDLKKYRIVKVRGVKHTENITSGLKNVHNLESPEQMMTYLKAGRADVALTNSMNGRKALTKLQYMDEIIPAGPALNQEKLYNYLHIRHRFLVPKVDSVIKAMKASGELKRLNKDAIKTVLESVY